MILLAIRRGKLLRVGVVKRLTLVMVDGTGAAEDSLICCIALVWLSGAEWPVHGDEENGLVAVDDDEQRQLALAPRIPDVAIVRIRLCLSRHKPLPIISLRAVRGNCFVLP